MSKVKYIIRYDGLGDALWVEPIINYYANKYLKVIFITHHIELFSNYPFNNVYIKNRLSKSEKLLMLIHNFLFKTSKFLNLNGVYEKKPKQHILSSYIEAANINIPLRYPNLYLSNIELINKQMDYKYIVLHLENSLGKNYRNIFGVNWELITTYLVNKGYKIIQVGKIDKQIKNTSYHATKSLRELIVLINNATFFVGADSGPSHIAASLSVPSLLFFGSVNPNYRHLNESFKGLILQQFCEYAGCYHEVISTFGQSCKIVGDQGIPKCSLHSDSFVISKIDQLIAQYKL